MASTFKPELFEAVMADFFAAYGQKFESQTVNRLNYSAWYECLSQSLAESELVPAMRNALIEFQFKPSPKQVVEAFKGSRELLAREEWNKCLYAVKNAKERECLLSPQGEKALESIGGFSRLNSEDFQKSQAFILKEFIKLWTDYERAIATGLIEPPAPKLPPSIEEPKPIPDKWTPEQITLFREKAAKVLGEEWANKAFVRKENVNA